MKQNISLRMIVRISQFLTLLLFCIIPFRSWATCSWSGNTGTVASPYDHTDVAACVSDASGKTGDVFIQIPACSVEWDAPLTINMSSGFSNVTSLTIQGAGSLPTTCDSATSAGLTTPTSCGSSGDTVITMNGAGIVVTGAPAKKWRISNLSISGAAVVNYAMIQPIGTSKPSDRGGFRIDHITFRDCTSTIIKSPYVGTTAGVIDHIDSISAIQFSNWAHLKAGGNTLWSSDPVQQDMIYIEDSYMQNSAMPVSKMLADGSYGASIVIRYNGIKDYYIGGHDASSDARGIRWYDVYNNQMITTGSYGSNLLALRGGAGVFYNNTFIATKAYPFYACTGTKGGICLTNYRSDTSISSKTGWPAIWQTMCDNYNEKMCVGLTWSSSTCTTDADCGGVTGTCQQIDGNIDISGYPCRDQIGRGTNQSSSPMLFWDNTISIAGAAAVPAAVGVNIKTTVPTNIQADRDFCDNATMMPSSCNGVNTTYTPYTYPHPLRGSTTPTIAVAPAMKDFGTLPINTSSPAQTFTVTTTGGDLKVDAISMMGTDAKQFTIQNNSCTGSVIAPETGSCTFDVKFTPSSVGTKTANVSIVDNDSNTTKLIAVNGTGTSQVPAMSFSPTSLSFSGVLSGTLSSPKTITLSNTSASFVTISSLILSGTNANQFSIPAAYDHCTGETVAAAGNCSFQVIFFPTSGGEKTANVNLTAQYYGSPAAVPIYGSAVVYPAPKIKISRKK